MNGHARVLLVEDDARLQRFVAMALEDLPIDLTCCSSVAEALSELARAPARLVITDLMLPADSGLVLIERLGADAALRGEARIVVFSAGLSAPLLEKLAGLSVWRCLSKPVSVADLEACVSEALAHAPSASSVGTPRRAAATDAPAANALPGAAATEGPISSAQRLRAIAEHFDGNAAIYEAFTSSCQARFRLDLDEGDAAAAAGDLAAMRRLAHSLKSVLLMLGDSEGSICARQLEDLAEQAQGAAIHGGWYRLRARLAQMILPR